MNRHLLYGSLQTVRYIRYQVGITGFENEGSNGVVISGIEADGIEIEANDKVGKGCNKIGEVEVEGSDRDGLGGIDSGGISSIKVGGMEIEGSGEAVIDGYGVDGIENDGVKNIGVVGGMNIGSIGGLGGGDTDIPGVEGADANDPALGTDGKEQGGMTESGHLIEMRCRLKDW